LKYFEVLLKVIMQI